MYEQCLVVVRLASHENRSSKLGSLLLLSSAWLAQNKSCPGELASASLVAGGRRLSGGRLTRNAARRRT